VLVVIVIAAIVIVAAMAFLASGRGAGLSAERADYAPLDLGPVSATDVTLLRPPMELWGYSKQATDEAMEIIADSIRERDVRIVALEQLVSDLGRDHAPAVPLGSPYTGARHRRPPSDAFGLQQPAALAGPPAPEPLQWPAGPFRPREPEPTHWSMEPLGPVEPPAEPVSASDQEATRWPEEPARPSGETSSPPPPEHSHD
jgi:hypothetical protein